MRCRSTVTWAFASTVVAVAAFAGCTPGGDSRSAATTLRSPPPSLASATGATPSSAANFDPSLPPTGAAAYNATATATVAANTIVMAVPPLPADLSPVRPTGPADDADGHDFDSDAASTPSGVAVAWIVALHTARFDDPDGLVADELAALAATSDVAAAAVAAVEPVDIDRSEARWPIVTAVSDTGAGTWRVEFVIKRTLTGQVGPSTSAPLAVDVTVSDGHVTVWSPVP